MKAQVKILEYLLEHKEESYSIRSIALHLRLHYRIAFEEIKKLEKESLVSIQRLGNTNLCSFSGHFNEKVFLVEKRRTEALLKNKNLKVLSQRISEIKNPFSICLLFGSYAKREQGKQSDIDLCIITNETEIKEKMEQTLRLLPLQIHLLIFSTEEFLSMLEIKSPNVGKEIVKNNIILKGIENFYELVYNA